MNETIIYKEQILCPNCKQAIDTCELDRVIYAKKEIALRAEAITWRWFVCFLITIFIGVTIATFIFNERFRAEDNLARAKHWERLETGDDRIRAMLDKQYTLSMNNSDRLMHCAACHGKKAK